MFKKITLVVLLGMIFMSAGSLSAQNDATIAPENIQYWIGEGENEVVVAISWCSNTETALAWGYRFSGNATVFQALTDIAAADSRLTVIGAAPTNITYVDENYNLTMCPNPNAQWGDADYDVPMHSVNGLMGQNVMSAEPISDNDFVKIGGLACATMAEDWSTISWTTEIIPAITPTGVFVNDMPVFSVYPNPATSAFNVNLTDVENVVELQVVDIQGRVVFSKEDMNGTIVTVSTENMDEGMYFVIVKSESAVFVNKLIVR